MAVENTRQDWWRRSGVLSGTAALTALFAAAWLMVASGYPDELRRAGGWAPPSGLGVPSPGESGVGASAAARPASFAPLVGAAHWLLGGWGDGPLVRVDSATGATLAIPVDDQARAVLVAFGSVWVAADDGVQKVDPKVGEVVDHVELPDGATALTTDGTRLWVRTGATAVAVDPASLRVVSTVVVGPTAGGLATDGRLLWVTDRQAGTVIGYDVLTGARRSVVQVGLRPDLVVYDGIGLWVSLSTSAAVVDVDPSRSTVQRTVTLGDGGPGYTDDPGVMTIVGGDLWVVHTRSAGAWWLSRVDRSTGAVTNVAPMECCTSSLAGDSAAIWVQVGTAILRVDRRTGDLSRIWG